MSHPSITIRDLRRLWKPHKTRLSQVDPEHPTNIRFHRAASWIQRGEAVQDDADLEIALVGYWVAFNALYGQWDEITHAPVSDVDCWRHFLDRMLKLDGTGFVVDILSEHKPLVMSIYEDEYLSRFYWNEPSAKQAGKAKQWKFRARSWYVEENWTMILDGLLERIYLLRCQVVHGASTYNGKLNRTAIRRCSQMLAHILQAFLQVWIHHGADEDWGIMCYPPQRTTSQNGQGRIPEALNSRPGNDPVASNRTRQNSARQSEHRSRLPR